MTILKLDDLSSESLRMTSQGNQRKWWDGQRFIKVDSHLGESMNEVWAYRLGHALGLKVQPYEACLVEVDNRKLKACCCDSFLESAAIFVSVSKILERSSVTFTKNQPTNQVFLQSVQICAKGTLIPAEEIEAYWYRMLQFDFLICNEDRHTNNFGFIYDTKAGKYNFAPLFDHGVAFLTDKEKYSSNLKIALQKFKMKPFSRDPLKNLITEAVYLEMGLGIPVVDEMDEWRKNIVLAQMQRLTERK